MPYDFQFNEEDRTPWVTYSLLALLALIFLAERHYAVTAPSFSPSIPTLVSLGGLNRTVVSVSYPRYKAALVGMIPQAEMPKTAQERADMSSELIAGARREMTTALAEETKISFIVGPKVENTLHAYLAALWLSDGQKDKAQQEFKPLCTASFEDPRRPNYTKL